MYVQVKNWTASSRSLEESQQVQCLFQTSQVLKVKFKKKHLLKTKNCCCCFTLHLGAVFFTFMTWLFTTMLENNNHY